MAPASALLIHPFLLYILLVCCYSCSTAHGGETESFLVVTRKQLNPRATCSKIKGSNHTILSLAHRHGPCSPLGTKKPLSLEQILAKDQLRVDYLQKSSSSSSTNDLLDSKATIPANYASGEYAITVSFGTPAKEQSVAMDTGSDLTWIQCKPCSVCYSQNDPIFDPSQSSSYTAIPCGSQDCASLKSRCSSSSCQYGITYGDGSTTSGPYSYETLTLSAGNAIERFLFGCGVDNEGLFQGSAGLMGLGRGRTSLVSQTSRIYGGIFSYCLPSTPRSTGFLKLGGPVASNAQYTSMLTNSNRPSFYFVDLTGIRVGGKDLGISPSVFTSRGTLLDSGTVITRLPAEAYGALRDAFRSYMTEYPAATPSNSLLDTCYDFSGHSTVKIPKVELQFGGGVSVDLDFYGILTGNCLAFAGLKNDGFGIIGNTQQRTFEVVYDVGNGKIGFAPGACT